ncbi:cytochrome P450 family 619 [Microdochium nivale]|nr:cytochrome P450 family 619 [Microdochium nivale]
MESYFFLEHGPRWLVVAIVLAASLRLVQFLGSAMRPKHYPPGPPTLPGIGNIHQIPTKQPFLKFTEWSKTYGGIIGLKVGPDNLVIISDPLYVHELFTKRGNRYSGRKGSYIPNQHVIKEHQNIHIFCLQCGPYLRKWRSFAKDLVNESGQKQTQPMQEATASQLCCSLLQTTPLETQAHLKHWALGTPLLAITGQRLEDRGQAFSDRFFQAQEQWLQLLEPGNTPPVDFIAPLRWVPEWCAKWKRKARYIRSYMTEEYFTFVKTARDFQESSGHKRRGLFRPLMTKMLDEESKETNDAIRFRDTDVAFCGGGLLDAAVDTTLATISSFVMFMATHPEAQERVFAEIDKLESRDLPPTGKDITDLPYLKACLLETYRLRPPAPSGLPHVLDRDDVFAGYTIPKGTTVLANVWGMQHDPAVYHKPEAFMPERFLDNPLGVKPGVSAEGRKATYTFGAGRRICPGEKFADASTLVTVAKMLWAFEIRPTDQIDLGVSTGFHDGLVLGPKPFKVEMKLRDEKRREGVLLDYEMSREALAEIGV